MGFNKGKDICEKFDNVEFYSLGKTQNIDEWTYYIYKFFKTYSQENTAIISLDDFWPLKKINYEELNKINNKILSDDRFVKACLSPNLYLEDTDIMIDGFRCVSKGPYMYTLQLSLWDVNYLKKIFEQKLSPWALELKEKKDNKLVIKTTNIHSNIFDTPLIKNFTCKCVIRTNTSSHLSSPYKTISLIGLDFEELKTIKNKYEYDNLFKICGRYWLNDKFDYKLFDNSYIIFKKINKSINNIFTSFYKIPNNNIGILLDFLIGTENDMKLCIGYEILFGYYLKYINYNNVKFIDKIGYEGKVTVDGTKYIG